MTFAMLNACIGTHNCSFADAMYEILGDDFTFIEFSKPKAQYGSSETMCNGIDYYANRPYVLRMFDSPENEIKARQLIDEVDVLRTGGEPFDWVRNRILSGKLTFRSSERFFKKVTFQTVKSMLVMLLHNCKYQRSNYRYLCLSAYLANDLRLVNLIQPRCYKFAYLTEITPIDIQQSILSRKTDKLKIVWCARFIDWKHPELMVGLAKRLLDSGRNRFEIKMIGAETTPLWNEIKQQIINGNISDYITLTGGIPNIEVLETMRNSDVFVFTSDRQEGWGTVLNEAMGAGCACVASNMIGSVPYLLKDKKNGLIFKSGSLKSLFGCVCELYDNHDLITQYAKAGYETITNEWSAKNCGRQLIVLSQSILDGKEIKIGLGPCSKARIQLY